jgi:hypothetical protein
MASINVFGKTCSGAKTLGNWVYSWETFRKWFRKPWSSCYSIEMFRNGFINKEWTMGDEGVGGFSERGHCV